MLTYNDPVAQAKDITEYAKAFAAEVALTTNRKVVFCCLDKPEANNLSFNLKREGYASEVKKGNATDRWYIAVYFN